MRRVTRVGRALSMRAPRARRCVSVRQGEEERRAGAVAARFSEARGEGGAEKESSRAEPFFAPSPSLLPSACANMPCDDDVRVHMCALIRAMQRASKGEEDRGRGGVLGKAKRGSDGARCRFRKMHAAPTPTPTSSSAPRSQPRQSSPGHRLIPSDTRCSTSQTSDHPHWARACERARAERPDTPLLLIESCLAARWGRRAPDQSSNRASWTLANHGFGDLPRGEDGSWSGDASKHRRVGHPLLPET